MKIDDLIQLPKVRDQHIKSIVPLISPNELKRMFPSNQKTDALVIESREIIKNIITRKDKRLLGIVGPCSIHDKESAIEYAESLKALAENVKDRIYLVMRVYFEKPRTTIGWKGLILDPHIDGSYDIASGLSLAREILLKITDIGVPAASEMLDPIVPQYIDDLVSWAAIGARTIESQTHRNLASGLSTPVGFKNGTSGSLELAVNAMESARHPAGFIGIDQDGNTSILSTTGNKYSHLILRGGKNGPNYHDEDVEEAEDLMIQAGLEPSIVVDCSHANSGKKWPRQKRVLDAIIRQCLRGHESLAGFMVESHLCPGNQPIPKRIEDLEYGVSITDECAGWQETETMILKAYEDLAPLCKEEKA